MAVTRSPERRVVPAHCARHRLPLRLRAPFELCVFAVAALALWRAESVPPAAIFAAVALVDAVGVTAFDQWEA